MSPNWGRSPFSRQSIYDFGGAENGELYYAMELLEGYDADTLVLRFGPVPPERAVYLIRQACDSLEEAHRAGMVHRDVKPANIFVCRHGLEIDFVKVLDFGLVKAAGGSAAGADRLTSEGALAGTPAFLSPEMALGGDVDWRSDIYALGCVAYWLLTGMPVFEADTSLKLALEHVKTPPVAPSRRSGLAIPKELDDTILACLAKDPRGRPQTAQELSERLASLGLEQAWTRRRAELWWRDHAPASADPVEPDGAARVARSA